MSELVVYNRELELLRATVAQLDNVDDAKDLADRAAAAQTWAQRARLGKDAVNQAAEVKLRAERRAGELLAAMPKHPPGREPYRSPSPTDIPTLEDLGVTKDQSSEWQKLARVPQVDFDAAIEQAKADGDVTRAGVTRRSHAVHFSSETDMWATPQALFDELHREFEFTLDVCATTGNAKCPAFYDEATDGLEQDWMGTCWMNPPYGDAIAKWVTKAYTAAQGGATVVCLLPARIDTGWWWDCCRYGEVRFLRGRLKFGDATNSAPFPSAVVIFGPSIQERTVYWER